MELDGRKPYSEPDAHRLDPIAVERLLRGREPVGRELSRREQLEAIRQAEDYGVGGNELTIRLGVSASAFSRLRNEIAADEGAHLADGNRHTPEG